MTIAINAGIMGALAVVLGTLTGTQGGMVDIGWILLAVAGIAFAWHRWRTPQ